MVSEFNLDSWRRFMHIAEHFDIGEVPRTAYAFRGQADSRWGLQPSLLRSLQPLAADEAQALEIERLALAEFRSQAHHHINPNVFTTTTDTISWWALMQHHGAPTRLLDWTASVYVAAYFAVIGHLDADGAIWVVHTHSVREEIAKRHSSAEPPQREGTIVEEYLAAGAPLDVRFFGRKNKSDRMIAQQGFFSVSRNVLADPGTVLADIFKEPSERELFRKLTVPARLKVEFTRRLRSMNISANALFPGLDGLARSVAELVQLGAAPRPR